MLHRRREVPVAYAVFDVLALNGEPTRNLPYAKRRELLESLALGGDSGFCPRSSMMGRRCRTARRVKLGSPLGQHRTRINPIRASLPFVRGLRVTAARLAVILLGSLLAGWTWDDASAAQQRTPALWKNCTGVNHKYPHGAGRVGATDSDTDGKRVADPVTNFKRSNRIYRVAMSYNKGLDRDKDGIACEKH
jgi:hypothetical protein